MGASFLNVSRGVARFRQRGLAHEQVYPERWQRSFLCLLDHDLVPLEVLGAGVLHHDVLESASLQEGSSLGWGNEVSTSTVCRPGQGIVWPAPRTKGGVTGREEGARPQYPIGFRDEYRPLGHGH